MLAWVSRDEDLYATDVVGSGTFGGGCGLDLDRWLPASCEVELRVEGLGSLVNRVQRRHRSPT
jgi:2-keto-4-pentenoate hydratase/2-oxohepta-3-ene-1,7-dioic acid hydratase in catechol pathway